MMHISARARVPRGERKRIFVKLASTRDYLFMPRFHLRLAFPNRGNSFALPLSRRHLHALVISGRETRIEEHSESRIKKSMEI